MSQIEIIPPLDTKFPTWIIAYCIDTDSFFVTNERFFWWEYDKEFQTEQKGIEYFKLHAHEFWQIREEIRKQCGGIRESQMIFLENTKEQLLSN